MVGERGEGDARFHEFRTRVNEIARDGEDPVLARARVCLERGERAVLGGLVPGAKALYLLHLLADRQGRLIVVTPDGATPARSQTCPIPSRIASSVAA